MSETPSPPEPGRIERRHVIYVQGYDPRGLAEYYRMFRGDYRRFLALYGLTGTIGKARHDDGRLATVWPIETVAKDWRVDTTYEFLRWDDLIREDFVRPAWHKTIKALSALFRRMLWQGLLLRIGRRNWRFAAFLAYPYLVLLAHVLLAALIGYGAAAALSALFGVPLISVAAGVALFAATLGILVRRTERLSYMLYMFDDITAHDDYAHGRRQNWERRFDQFARDLTDTVKRSTADEILIVGHSSGAIAAVDVLARALADDPDLGRHGPRVALLTVGSSLPVVGFLPEAAWFRQRIARIAVEPDVFWAEFQSRKDVMNLFGFDPVAGHGIDVGAARRNPTVLQVRFRDIIAPDNYAAFRWRFFDVHFQFLRANQRRGAAYDYFMICCGPVDLATRALDPQRALAATGEPVSAA